VVTALAAPRRDPGRSGLLEKLLAAVRPEFRAEVFLPDPADPVFRTTPCVVPGCVRSAAQHGLCNGHVIRWRHRGRPKIAEFLADPGPAVRGRNELTACVIEGCRFGGGGGLCTKHRDRWTRAGRPEPATWDAPALVTGAVPAECLMPFCTLWVENTAKVFCKNHEDRWLRVGKPDPEAFAEDCARIGVGHVDLRGLGRLLRLEFQYALQRRHGEQVRTASPRAVMEAVRRARAAGVASLLELTEAQWRRGKTAVRAPLRFLLDAREAVEVLRDGCGWDVEYPLDVWHLHKIPGVVTAAGRSCPKARLRFDRITQPWLRELAKRWIRMRLLAGRSIATVKANLDAATCFGRFLDDTGVTRLAEIDRPLLESYLAYLAGVPGSRTTKISGLNTFFGDIRRHGWDDSLPGSAAIFREDYPPPREQLSRRLAEFVMAQVESADNLAHWDDAAARLVTEILIRCGLRISSALTLDFDCIVHDGQGAPYLRYFNTKMRREAAVPIDEVLEAAIGEQHQRVLARWPAGTRVLFPRAKANAAGTQPLADGTYRRQLGRWLEHCKIHDEHGRPIRLTPHQWRHTFACRLINRDVPQEVVRVLLDHDSSRMTSHYARITDQTVRRRWEEATRVNIKGETVALDPEGPLGQAAWAKTRYGIATQTLPNGYCGLPVQKTCPHANACLTCPVFLTGPEFLPELREQHHRTLTIVSDAKTSGHTRVADMNQQVADNLDRMITQLEADHEREDVADAG
jgi:integrase